MAWASMQSKLAVMPPHSSCSSAACSACRRIAPRFSVKQECRREERMSTWAPLLLLSLTHQALGGRPAFAIHDGGPHGSR
eukprot:2568014-Pyramimonas_sp.AAC.1